MRFDFPEQKILVFETHLPIFWGDMDSYGHVNNAVYFKYMEHARIAWLQAMGGGQLPADEGPVLANTFCNYLKPLVFPGQMLVRVFVANPGRTSIDTFMTIERTDAPGDVCAQGGATLVWISHQDGRPRPLPAFLQKLDGPSALNPPAKHPALPAK
jgi:acyl-CoA thioester hydrolase